MPDDEAKSIMSSESGTHFDPITVTAFLDGFAPIQRARLDANELLSLGNETAVVANFYGLSHKDFRPIKLHGYQSHQ